MKKILILVSIVISFSLFSHAENINECKTDIYYGNGVWNTSDNAKDSREKLENRIVKLKIIKGDPTLKTKYGKVKLAYNWGQGTLLDVLETYYQLREAGQLDGVGFFTAMAVLTAYQPELTLGAIATQKLMEPFTKDWEQGNVDEMWNYHYYPESFKLGHRVLLVSHSQGNLFANRIFDTINPTEYKKYFANVQVASPANEVKADEVGKGAYVTLFGDPIINPIPGSMPGNANGSPGHKFVEAYLAQQDPYDKIVSRIKAVLPTLDVELTQWDTEGEPSNKGTCEEKVKVKHRFDVAVDMPFDVYPFNLSKKLYQVNGKWVKASCGGTHILDQWDGKKENECWMIDNVEREKIVAQEKQLIAELGCSIYVHNHYRPLQWSDMTNASRKIDCSGLLNEVDSFAKFEFHIKGPQRIDYDNWDAYRNAGYKFAMQDLLTGYKNIATNHLALLKRAYLKKYPNANIVDKPPYYGAYDGSGFGPNYPPCSVYATNKYNQGCGVWLGFKVYK